MNKIWLTSDLHFNHDREFIWKPRGFKSCEEMNEAIISKYNSVVEKNDDVYILGDMMLGGSGALKEGLKYIEQLNGRLHLVRGNHDSATRWDAFRYLSNVVEMRNSIYLDYNGYHFYLSHYPSITGSLHQDNLKKMLLNLFGHTHQKESFFEDMPFMFHVGIDSNMCYPVPITKVISMMKAKVEECKSFLDEPEELTAEDKNTKSRNIYKITKCDKCVWQNNSCPGPRYFPITHCPDDFTYKRDPPDGGYYG